VRGGEVTQLGKQTIELGGGQDVGHPPGAVLSSHHSLNGQFDGLPVDEVEARLPGCHHQQRSGDHAGDLL
jgi:hypothetical protein